MNIIARISSRLCLLIIFSVLCVAQEKVEIPRNPPPPPPMQPLPVIKEVGKAKVLYDERRNKTFIQTSLLQVQGEWRNGIRLRAEVAVSGKEVARPSDVTLLFFSAARDRTYADNRALKILIDGKEVLSGEAKYQIGDTDGEVFMIVVSQDIPYEMFLRLINAKSVKMQLGPTEFELKGSDLESLKDLQRIIG